MFGKRADERIDRILGTFVESHGAGIAGNRESVRALLQRIEGLEQRLARLEALHMHAGHLQSGIVPGCLDPADGSAAKPAAQE